MPSWITCKVLICEDLHCFTEGKNWPCGGFQPAKTVIFGQPICLRDHFGFWPRMSATCPGAAADPRRLQADSGSLHRHFSPDRGSSLLNRVCRSRPCGVRSTNSTSTVPAHQFFQCRISGVAAELPSSHRTLTRRRRTGSLAHGNAVGKRVNRMLSAVGAAQASQKHISGRRVRRVSSREQSILICNPSSCDGHPVPGCNELQPPCSTR
jgi:hypothetical protein